MNRNWIAAIVPAVLVAFCCLCALVIGSVFAVYQFDRSSSSPATLLPPPTETDADLSPTAEVILDLTPSPTALPGEPGTLTLLENEELPANDLRELAMRLKGISDIPTVVSEQPADWPIGTALEFNALNHDSDSFFTVKARLIYKSENVYFFAGSDTRVNEADVKKLVDDFQQNAYVVDREFFGSEPNPGIDGDPRLYILYAGGMGFSVAGSQSSADSYSRLAQPRSNEKEMFYVNADAADPRDPYLLSVLAHEFQHMIQDHQDGNEDTWMNEGASVLAEFLNGYGSDGFDYAFVANPDLQLNFSQQDPAEYGAGFLFLAYFLDRFGRDATKALVADPANGLRAVDDVLASQPITDPATGRSITAVDVFADWVIANYLGDPAIADGRYAYHNYLDAPKVSSPTGVVGNCPAPPQKATVHQFAADYYEINCSGRVTITFTGSRQVNVTPATPHSGGYVFWSNRGDKSDTTLTREFDLTGLASAALDYWVWWDIEKDYDYAYVEVSTDNGATWTILKTPSGTDTNPTGNSYGWGYTDKSGGESPEWVEEKVDLSAYAGQKILLRFEYITDDAVNGAGFVIDDVSIPELNYRADFEQDAGGWDGAGFVRMNNSLPQTFVVQVIRRGAPTTVERLPLDDANTGSLSFDLASGESAVLVVSGTTQFTTEMAGYQFEIK